MNNKYEKELKNSNHESNNNDMKNHPENWNNARTATKATMTPQSSTRNINNSRTNQRRTATQTTKNNKGDSNDNNTRTLGRPSQEVSRTPNVANYVSQAAPEGPQEECICAADRARANPKDAAAEWCWRAKREFQVGEIVTGGAKSGLSAKIMQEQQRSGMHPGRVSTVEQGQEAKATRRVPVMVVSYKRALACAAV